MPPKGGTTKAAASRQKYLRQKGEELLKHLLVEGWSAEDSLQAVSGKTSGDLPKRLQDSLRRAKQLQEGFARKTPQEIDNLLAALNGRFHSPGAGE